MEFSYVFTPHVSLLEFRTLEAETVFLSKKKYSFYSFLSILGTIHNEMSLL
jgi:hypothetical protein